MLLESSGLLATKSKVNGRPPSIELALPLISSPPTAERGSAGLGLDLRIDLSPHRYDTVHYFPSNHQSYFL